LKVGCCEVGARVGEVDVLLIEEAAGGVSERSICWWGERRVCLRESGMDERAVEGEKENEIARETSL